MIWQPVHSIFQNVVLFSWKYLIGQLCVGHPSDSMKLHCNKNNISFHFDNICLYIPNAHKMHARILLKCMLRCICHICVCFLLLSIPLNFFCSFFLQHDRFGKNSRYVKCCHQGNFLVPSTWSEEGSIKKAHLTCTLLYFQSSQIWY